MIKKKAKLIFKHNYFEIVEEGDHVLCAISGKEIKTPNEKVFKSNEDFLSKEALDKSINDLLKAVDENDHIKIKEILVNNVEGYSIKNN